MRVFNEIAKRKTSKRLLIVDLNNAVHKAIYVHPVLSSEGKYTGGLYGVLAQIKKAALAYEATDIIICNDSPPYLRGEILEYKAGRRGDRNQDLENKLQETRTLCKEFFKLLNIVVWEVEGMESDDLISSLVGVLSCKVYILSGDSDLFQCLELNRVKLIRNKSVLYTEEDFEKDYGIPTSKWAWVVALSGGHNGLPGFPGIGEKKAIEIVKSDSRLLRFVNEYPKSLLYYQLAKLPLFEIKDVPKITFPKKRNLLEAELFLRGLNFKVEKEE